MQMGMQTVDNTDLRYAKLQWLTIWLLSRQSWLRQLGLISTQWNSRITWKSSAREGFLTISKLCRYTGTVLPFVHSSELVVEFNNVVMSQIPEEVDLLLEMYPPETLGIALIEHPTRRNRHQLERKAFLWRLVLCVKHLHREPLRQAASLWGKIIVPLTS